MHFKYFVNFTSIDVLYLKIINFIFCKKYYIQIIPYAILKIQKVIVLYRTIKIQSSLNRTNQSTIIKEAINSYLDKGVTDKQDIYTKVVDELGVPRPTVRRVARDLRTELLQKIQILQSDMPKATTTSEKDE